MYLLAIPGVLYFAIFKIAPLWGLSLAFVDYNSFKGLLESEFVGFANFLKFFRNNNFWLMIRNTVVISLMNLIFPSC